VQSDLMSDVQRHQAATLESEQARDHLHEEIRSYTTQVDHMHQQNSQQIASLTQQIDCQREEIEKQKEQNNRLVCMGLEKVAGVEKEWAQQAQRDNKEIADLKNNHTTARSFWVEEKRKRAGEYAQELV
jgi:hypothetical protein